MTQTPFVLQGEMLTYRQDGQNIQVVVDTAGWYAWLETASTFTFRSDYGSFTARLERAGNKRGGQYWRAYRKRHGKLHRAYLGKSEELTLERLKEVATVLACQASPDTTKATANGPGGAILQSSEEPHDGQVSFLSATTTLFPHSNENERKRTAKRDLPTGTITLLCSDIEGSTRLEHDIGDQYADVLSECHHLLRTVFQEYNGHQVETQGDTIFVAFARATDAVAAAVAAQQALVSHTFSDGAVLQIRIGLHTGEPELASEGYVGLDVHHTAQIMRAGHGGQVLLSQTTRELVEDTLPEGVLLRDLGKHRLKDLQRPNRLFQLVIAGLPTDFPPLKTFDAHPNNLPLLPTPFIGREREIAEICQILQRQEIRLLTLTGSGGVGKTRLGLQVAAELSDLFTHGSYFVNLAPLSNPDLVLPTIAWTLGLQERGEQTLLDLLQAFLRDKHVLLLLDNFEQVVSAAVQVAALLAACPYLKLVVTSRMALSVRAEHEFAVPPLALPDLKRLPDAGALAHSEAVELFIQRAQAIQPTFQLTQANAPAIAEICTHLDGLPLAIELAAARIKLLPPHALLHRLSRRLEVLTGGARDLPIRQQTLRNTIQWSYDLLTEQEQRIFRRLSVFVGGCTLEAVEAVCCEESNEPLDMLERAASFVDKSLVQQTERQGEEPRLLMLETLREYGLERLYEQGEVETTRRAHAMHYLRFAEEASRHLFSTEAGRWFERLEREHENLRAALAWVLEDEDEEVGSDIETAARLGSALWRFWTVRGHMSEGRTVLERVLAASKEGGTPVRAKALVALATLCWHQGDYARVGEIMGEMLALCKQLGDQQGIAHTLLGMAGYAAQQRDYARARSLAEESLAICRAEKDTWRSAALLSLLGRVASAQREHARARQLLEESLDLYRALGYPGDTAWSLIYLARDAIAQGEHVQARTWMQEALTLCRVAGNKWGIAHALSLLGREALEQGDVAGAHDLLTECHLLNQESGIDATLPGRFSFWRVQSYCRETLQVRVCCTSRACPRLKHRSTRR